MLATAIAIEVLEEAEARIRIIESVRPGKVCFSNPLRPEHLLQSGPTLLKSAILLV